MYLPPNLQEYMSPSSTIFSAKNLKFEIFVLEERELSENFRTCSATQHTDEERFYVRTQNISCNYFFKQSFFLKPRDEG